MSASADFLTLLVKLGHDCFGYILATATVLEMRDMPLHPLWECRGHRELVFFVPDFVDCHRVM